MTTIGFTGHRDKLCNPDSLRHLEERYPGATWVHGGAEGFDSQVDKVARETLIVIRSDYRQYRPKIAPLIRNQWIVDSTDFMVACYDNRIGGGTWQCITYAGQRGKRVEYVTPVEKEKVS